MVIRNKTKLVLGINDLLHIIEQVFHNAGQNENSFYNLARTHTLWFLNNHTWETSPTGIKPSRMSKNVKFNSKN